MFDMRPDLSAANSTTPLESPKRVPFQGGIQAADALLEQIAGLPEGKISRRDALRVPTVLRARNVIAGVPATLPIELRNRDRELDERRWLGPRPDSNIERTVHYALTFEDLLLHGVSYWRVTSFSEGFPLTAEHIDQRSVSQQASISFPSAVISEDQQFHPDDPIFIDGIPVPPREIIRFVSPNPPLLVHAARAIRTALLLEEAARNIARDPLPLGYFTDKENTNPLDDDKINVILSSWERARRQRVWGYVAQGLDLKTLDWPDPGQLQLVEERQHAVLEIARAAGLDPEDVGVHMTTRTYQNAEERKSDLVDLTLSPYLSAVEDRLSMDDVTPRGLTASFDPTRFVRANFTTRMEGAKLAMDAGLMTRDELRRREGLPRMDPLDEAAAEDRMDRAARTRAPEERR